MGKINSLFCIAFIISGSIVSGKDPIQGETPKKTPIEAPGIFLTGANGIRFSVVYKNDEAAHNNGRKGLQAAIEAKDSKNGKLVFLTYLNHQVDANKNAPDHVYQLDRDEKNRLVVTTGRQKYLLDADTGKLFNPIRQEEVDSCHNQYRLSVNYRRVKNELFAVIYAKDIKMGHVVWRYDKLVFRLDSVKKDDGPEFFITLEIDAMNRLVVTNTRQTFLLDPCTGKLLDKK